jgi:hypothetical protein
MHMRKLEREGWGITVGKDGESEKASERDTFQ